LNGAAQTDVGAADRPNLISFNPAKFQEFRAIKKSPFFQGPSKPGKSGEDSAGEK
jgi:hypothetical protein